MKIIGVNKQPDSYTESTTTFICEIPYDEMKLLRNFICDGYECSVDKIKQSDMSGLTVRIEKALESENNLSGIIRSHNALTDYLDKAMAAKGKTT